MENRFTQLVLGGNRKRSVRLTRTLGASGIFLVCLVLEYVGVALHLVDGMQAALLAALILTGQAGFYVAIRSGFTERWHDPALTLHQMVFAIVALTLAYAINPMMRGMMPMIMALVLVFGTFILPPVHCRLLGWMCVACLGLVISACAWHLPLVFEPRIEAFHFLLSALVLPAIANLAAQLSALRIKLRQQKDALHEALDRVHELATRDDLTRLPNRRHAYELWDYELQRNSRVHRPLCICLIDIDHFKYINDRMGHQAGDDALQLFARILAQCLRTGDILARWGGEEFMLLLPGTSPEESLKIVERMRLAITNPQNWISNPALQVSFSAGLTLQIHDEPRDETMARADSALYAAKHQGRDRVLVR